MSQAGSDMTAEEQETLTQEFFDSVYTGTIATTKRLLKRGFPINTQVASYGQADLYLPVGYTYDDVVEAFKIGIEDSYDQTPLFLTCWAGRYDMACLLVKWRADLNLPNREGMTPLIVASRNGHEKIVVLLLDVGREQDIVNAQDLYGQVALVLASFYGHHKTVGLLLNNGANVNLADNTGYTPLMAASHNGHEKTVQLLLDALGIEVNSQDSYGQSALWFASYYGHHKTVGLLLKHGANMNLPNRDGCTPLIAASLEGHLQIIELLVDAGAKLDPKHSDSGNTALHSAIEHATIEAAELLIDSGANLLAENNDGSTPLDLADSEEIKARLLMRCKLYETRKELTTTREELATLKSFVFATSFGNISSTNIQLATLQGEVEKLRREMTKLRKNRDTAQLRREMTKVKKENARLQRDHDMAMAKLEKKTTYLILAVVLNGLVMVVGFLIISFGLIG